MKTRKVVKALQVITLAYVVTVVVTMTIGWIAWICADLQQLFTGPLVSVGTLEKVANQIFAITWSWGVVFSMLVALALYGATKIHFSDPPKKRIRN